MLNSIELGGKIRPILFGNTVFRRLKRDHGITSIDVCGEIAKGDFSSIADVVYMALRVGEEFQRVQTDEFTVDQVSMWLDTSPAALKQVIDMFADAIFIASGNDVPTDAPDPAKKKPKS